MNPFDESSFFFSVEQSSPEKLVLHKHEAAALVVSHAVHLTVASPRKVSLHLHALVSAFTSELATLVHVPAHTEASPSYQFLVLQAHLFFVSSRPTPVAFASVLQSIEQESPKNLSLQPQEVKAFALVLSVDSFKLAHVH